MGDHGNNDWEEQVGGDIAVLCEPVYLRSLLDDQCGDVVWMLQYSPL